jgi:hypothetical protein
MDRKRAANPVCSSPAEVGFIRLRPLYVPNSGKPEFGWQRGIAFETTLLAWTTRLSGLATGGRFGIADGGLHPIGPQWPSLCVWPTGP